MTELAKVAVVVGSLAAVEVVATGASADEATGAAAEDDAGVLAEVAGAAAPPVVPSQTAGPGMVYSVKLP